MAYREKNLIMDLVPLLVTMATLSLVSCKYSQHGNKNDIHGGVKMGEPNAKCDDGKGGLELDWDDSTNFETRCQPAEEPLFSDTPLHKCMDIPIHYLDTPPMAGPHRPLWPVFGEYEYLPPQRWVHALEHGAAVFLYHPCAQPSQVQSLKRVARSCLRKHIITPYRQLPPSIAYAVVTYGCRLLMADFSEDLTKEFVRAHAMTAPEKLVRRHGDYSYGLLEKAKTVSDSYDSELCPSQQTLDVLMTAENMD